MIIGVPHLSTAQQSAESLSRELKDLYGFEKLEGLINVIAVALEEGPKSAMKYARQADEMLGNLYDNHPILSSEQSRLQAIAINQVGLAYFENERYSAALQYFNTAYLIAQKQGQLDEMTVAATYAQEAEELGGAEPTGIGGAIKQKLNGIRLGGMFQSNAQRVSINTAIKLGDRHAANGNYRKGIEQYDKAIAKLRNHGDYERIRQLELVMADWQVNSGNFEEAIGLIQKNEIGTKDTSQMSDRMVALIKEMEVIEDQKSALQTEPSTASQPNDQRKAPVNIEGITSSREIVEIARQLESNSDYAQSLAYYKIYVELQEQLAAEEKQRELDIQEKNFQIEQRSQEVALLNQQQQIQSLELENRQIELNRQSIISKYLLWGLAAFMIIAVVVLWLYRAKRRDHRKLTIAYSDLDDANTRLAEAEQRIKTLLTQQVSGAVAEELIGGKADKTVSRKFVAIMFVDIRGFTPFAESRDPEEIIQYQNDVFSFMIEIVSKHGGVINQFMGDGFMATFGAPVSHENDAQEAYLAGQEILEVLSKKNAQGEIPLTQIGIGLHAGWVVAGNVGTSERMQYSITGNTVITAARLEQMNKQYDSSFIISDTVLDQLEEGIHPTGKRETVALKGRSEEMGILVVNRVRSTVE